MAFLPRMDKLRQEISPVGMSVATIVPTPGPNKDYQENCLFTGARH